MAIVVWELISSRSQTIGTNPKLDRNYFLTGESDDSVVRAFLNSTLLATIDGLWLDSYDLDPAGDDSYWTAVAHYIDKEDKEDSNTATDPKNRRVRFTGAAVNGIKFDTPNVQQGYKAGGDTTPIPDFGNSLNVQGDKIEGAPIIFGAGSFQETHTVPIANVTNAEILRLLDSQGKINSDVFRDAEAQEVLFVSFDVNWDGGAANEADVVYNFQYSKNEVNKTVGPITGINKKGWQFLWQTYLTDAADGKNTRTIKNVFVADVYDQIAFATLLISQV